MTITDAAVLFGAETTYGTAATLTRGFEAKADSWKREQTIMESVGMRAGMAAQRSDRRRVVNLGGGGSLEVDVLTKGFGLILQSLLGGAVAPTQQAATTAYLQTFTATKEGSTKSYTVQVQRPDVNDTVRSFTHLGAVPTAWGLKQELDANLVLNIDFTSQDVKTDVANGVPAYPANAAAFHWGESLVTVNSVNVDSRSFEFAADLARKTDRRYLRQNVLKKFPKRQGVPSYSGTIVADFEDLTLYNLFTAGTIVPITAKWTGATIEGAHNFELVLTMPACQFTGESPEVSLDDLPSQPLPFTVLDDGTNPPVTMTYKSTDTTV